MSILKASFTNTLSRVFGKIASTKFPSFIQILVNNLYVKITGVDLDAFYPASHYESLNALFTRSLRFDREFSKDPKSIISPADSFISSMGEIKNGQVLQIKGFKYNISELLTEHIANEDIEAMNGGKFINFYLSPKDYHRYHVPMTMSVRRAIHVPGALYPVNFKYLRKVPYLFVKNERVVLECYDTENRLFFIILVGALNVGKMRLSFDDRIETNVDASKMRVYDYSSVTLEKGDELGMFMMGSTIVMLFEKDFVSLENSEGKKVRYTDVIANKE